MMDAFDDRLDEAARALGESLPDLPDELDDRIMARIRRTDAPTHRHTDAPAPSGIRWIFEPRPVKVRPIWVGLAAAALIVLALLPRGTRTPAPAAQVARASQDTVYVHFQVSAPSARNVSLAGSFNNWDAAGLSLHRAADGSWEATVALPVGEHRYQFVVDGQRWIPDPAAQAQVDDGFGGTNSVIVVGPKGVVRS
jgi:hypothetical protein